MRKLILIAALVLASASAQAGDTRNLTLAASDLPADAQQATAAEAPVVEAAKPETVKAEAPKYVDRPAAVSTTADAAKAESTKPVAVQAPRGEKSKRRPYWTEARIIGELHRHGVYW